jgi:hypothetical protein
MSLRKAFANFFGSNKEDSQPPSPPPANQQLMSAPKEDESRKEKQIEIIPWTYWQKLPSELQLVCLSFLSPATIATVCSVVCKEWTTMCNSNFVWKAKIQELITNDYISSDQIDWSSNSLKEEFKKSVTDQWGPNKFHTLEVTEHGRKITNLSSQAGFFSFIFILIFLIYFFFLFFFFMLIFEQM